MNVFFEFPEMQKKRKKKKKKASFTFLCLVAFIITNP